MIRLLAIGFYLIFIILLLYLAGISSSANSDLEWRWAPGNLAVTFLPMLVLMTGALISQFLLDELSDEIVLAILIAFASLTLCGLLHLFPGPYQLFGSIHVVSVPCFLAWFVLLVKIRKVKG